VNTNALLSKGEDVGRTEEGKKKKENISVFRDCVTKENLVRC